MREYEIYLPTKQRDRKKIPAHALASVREKLKQAFGGYTEMQSCKGVWQCDGDDLRDKVTILRVLDDGTARFDMKAFRRSTEKSLQQDHLLITVRNVESL